MPGVILALLEQPETAPRLLAAAGTLAGLLGEARIEALVVRTPPEATILPSEEVLTHRQEAEVRAREQERAAALHRAFAAWTAPAGIAAEWHDIEGFADAVLTERGSRADVILLRRPAGPAPLPAWQSVHTALFRTDRPVLVVPPGPPAPFGRRVAIAWREDRPATRAVLSALRCRARPEQVHVLAGIRPGTAPPAMPAILQEHGIAATLHPLPIGPAPFGRTLLDKAHALGADLLVMGAYLHSPLRELILGGVTRHMLAHADLPVLMRH